MPLLTLTLAGLSDAERLIPGLQADCSRLMQDILHKSLPLTVVSVSCLPAAALSAGGVPVAAGAHLQAYITAGTNTAAEKSAFIAAAHALLAGILPAGAAAPLYVAVIELPASDWGYDGRSQADRRVGVAA